MTQIIAQINKENLTVRQDFDVSKFNTKINEKGIDVYWEKMMWCPCRKDSTSQAITNCTNCNGSGYVWYDKQIIRALVSGASLNKNFIQWTEVLEGSIYVTVDPFYKVGWYDRLTVKDALTVFSEVHKTVAGVGGVINYTTHYPVSNIIRAAKYVGAAVGLYDININNINITSNPLVINDNNIIAGNSISLLYEYNPVYLVVDNLNDYRNTYVKNKLPIEQLQNAPIRILAKKMHLVLNLG